MRRGLAIACLGLLACSKGQAPLLSHGPFLGAIGAREARVWARASGEGDFELRVAREGGAAEARSLRERASEESDFTLHFAISGLEPGARYRFSMGRPGEAPAAEGKFATLPAEPASSARIAFGSCADERRFPRQAAWGRMRERGAEAVVLLGDTPYIDGAALETQRARYRAFFAHPDLASLLRTTPLHAVWDDHDYVGNDRFGAQPGREEARRAFLEYHAPEYCGERGQGIFSRFRLGPIEVFLLDTRWFADSEPSAADPSRKTLLGAEQWAWLEEGLRASTAPFKALACGKIWNDATRPGKVDFVGHWPHEREALFRFLGREEISGVLLVGGDVHRSRAIRHATKEIAGYDLTELVTSPLANATHENAAVAHPGLLFDGAFEQSFLMLSADASGADPLLVAELVDAVGGTVFRLEMPASSLGAGR